jgi:hypothetical protein
VYDQRAGGWPTFDRVYARHSPGVESIRSQSVDRFRREGYQSASSQKSGSVINFRAAGSRGHT